MSAASWTLANGVKVQFEYNCLEVQFPGTETWVRVVTDERDLRVLVAIIAGHLAIVDRKSR